MNIDFYFYFLKCLYFHNSNIWNYILKLFIFQLIIIKWNRRSLQNILVMVWCVTSILFIHPHMRKMWEELIYSIEHNHALVCLLLKPQILVQLILLTALGAAVSNCGNQDRTSTPWISVGIATVVAVLITWTTQQAMAYLICHVPRHCQILTAQLYLLLIVIIAIVWSRFHEIIP